MLLAIEDLKEIVKDDPAEIAAKEALDDEIAMEKRMDMIHAFVEVSHSFKYTYLIYIKIRMAPRISGIALRTDTLQILPS